MPRATVSVRLRVQSLKLKRVESLDISLVGYVAAG